MSVIAITTSDKPSHQYKFLAGPLVVTVTTHDYPSARAEATKKLGLKASEGQWHPSFTLANTYEWADYKMKNTF